MRIRFIFVLGASILAACASAQQPMLTSFQPDGTITWTNISVNCIVVVEELAPATSSEWSAIHMETATASVSSAQLAMTSRHAWFRVANSNESSVPPGMVLIPAGSFSMGDSSSEGGDNELPVHSVYVSEFYMDATEVTKTKWDEVYNWAVANGYTYDNAGTGKAANHPVYWVSWYDAVKWCNARSEKEGLTPAYYTSSARTTVYRTGGVDLQNDWVRWDSGYRLPTEAEWEKAARGGLSGQRFPWGETINHDHANYIANGGTFTYDTSPYSSWTYHPDYMDGIQPYTSPVGSFVANGYGLYDMTGNVFEWCWDWWSNSYYGVSPETDPRGPASGSSRVYRCGSWNVNAYFSRVAHRRSLYPDVDHINELGFRAVLPSDQG